MNYKGHVEYLKSSATGMGLRNTDDYDFTMSVTRAMEIAKELERLYKIERLYDSYQKNVLTM